MDIKDARVRRSLGLNRAQAAVFEALLEHWDRHQIPFDELAIVARHAANIPWDELLITVPECADILGVSERTVSNLAESEPIWMRPFAEVRNFATGNVSQRLWLRPLVSLYGEFRSRVGDAGS